MRALILFLIFVAVNAGRYEGAKAEKAVPFPGVAAHRSPAMPVIIPGGPARLAHQLRRPRIGLERLDHLVGDGSDHE